MRTKFHKCAGFAGILRAGRQQQLECPPDGIVGEKVSHKIPLKTITRSNEYKCVMIRYLTGLHPG